MTGDAAVDKRAYRTVSPHDRRAARHSGSDDRQRHAADPANRTSAVPGEEPKAEDDETITQQALYPTVAAGIVSAGG